MTSQVRNLMNFLSSLPEAEQIILADLFLEEAQKKTSAQIPKKNAFLEEMFERTKRELENGETISLDEFIHNGNSINT